MQYFRLNESSEDSKKLRQSTSTFLSSALRCPKEYRCFEGCPSARTSRVYYDGYEEGAKAEVC